MLDVEVVVAGAGFHEQFSGPMAEELMNRDLYAPGLGSVLVVLRQLRLRYESG